jgi:hypothetical protein
MKHFSAPFIAIGVILAAPACVQAASQSVPSLRPDTPQCKMPKAHPPRLGVDVEYDRPTEIKADFNGDGWCDYALGVPYPINSQMHVYDLSKLMALGQANGWKPVFNGKKSYEFMEKGYAQETWPTLRIDLTDIRLVFPARQGAPFVLGLFAGGEEGKRNMGNGCTRYRSVYRWDDALGTFKKSDDTTRDAVLKYFYSVIEKPCGVLK